MSLKPKDNDFVSQDKDWRSLISNELKSSKQWEEDWEFLVTGKAHENALIDDKISQLESRLQEINEQGFLTTAAVYGKGANLEKYRITDYNITKTPDLRPCDRKPRKKR